MPSGCEFYTSDTNLLQFSSVYPPYIYLGKTDVGANAGANQTTTARNQDSLAPTYSVPIELCTVSAPANAVQVAVVGDKKPSGINIWKNPNTGNWECNFCGIRSGSCTLYFFGLHPGTEQSGTNANMEFKDESGTKVIFDVSRKPMMIRSGLLNGEFSQTVPSGRSYGVMMQVYGVQKGQVYIRTSSQGSRRFVNYSLWGGYTSGSTVGITSYVRDIEFAQTSEGDDPENIRSPRGMLVDVTGL